MIQHVSFIDLKRQYVEIKAEVDQAMASVFETGQFVGGHFVQKFEEEFAEYIGVSHCVSCGNGTDALELALLAFGVGHGDEVIIPSMNWVSAAEMVLKVGAKPVFVDVLQNECTIDPEKISSVVTSRSKAIIPVHLYGLPVHMDEVLRVAHEHSLIVIEDCAQAHGATIRGRKVGSFGHAATFSFYPTKNLGSYGDGGAITTNDVNIALKLTLLKNYGQERKNIHVIHGQNSRLDTLQAAILSVKLKYLDNWNIKRRQLASLYRKNLKHFEIPTVPEGFEPAYYVFSIMTDNREQLIKHLQAYNIQTGTYYPAPIHLLPTYEHLGYGNGDFISSESIASRTLSLPIYPELRSDEVEFVCEKVNEFIAS